MTDDIPTERCRITRMQTGSVFCSKRSRTGVRTLPDARPPGAPRHPRRGFMYNATFRHTSNTQPHPPSLSSAHDAREARSAAVPSWRGRHSRPPAGRIAHGCAYRSRTTISLLSIEQNSHHPIKSVDRTSARGETRRRRIRAATRQAHFIQPARPLRTT